ncbi:MAG TPA: YihY/virulence factor BrkB family protein [Pseudacidobacterium sp.]|jgi:membrane protein|nr:YihY/virulence factor BrkB family protein [Pseudacidobacterium sp.]
MKTAEKRPEKLRHACGSVGRFAVLVCSELLRTRAFTAAAGLAFYFLLSMVPLLIVFASLLHFLPINDVVFELLSLLGSLIPKESMNFVLSAVESILTPAQGKVIPLSIIGYLWAATDGFVALIEALDIAYDVEPCRQWWRARLKALLLTFTVGALSLFSLLVIIVGPRFGDVLMHFFQLRPNVGRIWPIMRWVITVVTFMTGIELMYYLGPRARHSFWSTLPGAAAAMGIWFLGSFGLSFYLSNITNYDRLYGAMGAVIGLMLWLYISSLAVLIGAELNGEWAKVKQRNRSEAYKISAAGSGAT